MFASSMKHFYLVQKCGCSALLSTHNLIKRFRHKIAKESEKPSKAAADVVKYLESISEYKEIINELPQSLLRKYKTPESIYLINKDTAKDIANILKKHLSGDCPVVEVNPGLGLLTQELIQCHKNRHYLYESSSHFTNRLHTITKLYGQRITCKVPADFFGMWKLAFRDKMDNGNRMQELLGDLITDNNKGVKIVGSMPGLSFLKHMVYNIVFHNSVVNHLGRPDLFITMPAYHFDTLTENQQNRQKSLSSLFQLLFDYEILGNVPNVHFLPWITTSENNRAVMMDDFCLHLINITQKEKLPCPPDYLPLLWYFFKIQVFSKSTRIIPKLEQWIPGCGVWLITGQDPPDTNKALSPGEDDAPLPHMTIFTEFADLTLQQKVTVFKRFISWPEFEHCPFRVSMENNLPKTISAVDDDAKVSEISSHIDELEHSDVEHEEQLT